MSMKIAPAHQSECENEDHEGDMMHGDMVQRCEDCLTQEQDAIDDYWDEVAVEEWKEGR